MTWRLTSRFGQFVTIHYKVPVSITPDGLRGHWLACLDSVRGRKVATPDFCHVFVYLAIILIKKAFPRLFSYPEKCFLLERQENYLVHSLYFPVFKMVSCLPGQILFFCAFFFWASLWICGFWYYQGQGWLPWSTQVGWLLGQFPPCTSSAWPSEQRNGPETYSHRDFCFTC